MEGVREGGAGWVLGSARYPRQSAGMTDLGRGYDGATVMVGQAAARVWQGGGAGAMEGVREGGGGWVLGSARYPRQARV